MEHQHVDLCARQGSSCCHSGRTWPRQRSTSQTAPPPTTLVARDRPVPFRQDGQWLWAVSLRAGRLFRPALGTVMNGFRAGPGLMPTVSASAGLRKGAGSDTDRGW